MSEQDTDISPRVQAALLNQLVRQEERISMLEALLEETRQEKTGEEQVSQEQVSQAKTGKETTASQDARPQAEPGQHSARAMSFEAIPKAEPSINTARALSSEREPIRLPEFTGSGLDVIADRVVAKASERTRPAMMQNVLPHEAFAPMSPAADAEDVPYERTARLNAPLLRRHYAETARPSHSMLKKAGGMALLSVAVAALCVGVWQKRQSASLSDSIADAHPLPLLAAPLALLPQAHSATSLSAARRSTALSSRPLKALPPTMSLGGNAPTLEPQTVAPALLHHQRGPSSGSITASAGARFHTGSVTFRTTAHSGMTANESRPARQAEHVPVAVGAARGFKAPRAYASLHRQANVSDNSKQAAQTHIPVRVAASTSASRANDTMPSDPNATAGNPQSFSSPDTPAYHVGEDGVQRPFRDEFGRDESAQHNPERRSRRRRRTDPPESFEVTQPSREEPPRPRTQDSVRRAARTLDNMQDLLDSIERRKHRAEANSE